MCKLMYNSCSTLKLPMFFHKCVIHVQVHVHRDINRINAQMKMVHVLINVNQGLVVYKPCVNSVTFLDALMEERYHLTTSIILSLGSLRSAALRMST